MVFRVTDLNTLNLDSQNTLLSSNLFLQVNPVTDINGHLLHSRLCIFLEEGCCERHIFEFLKFNLYPSFYLVNISDLVFDMSLLLN